MADVIHFGNWLRWQRMTRAKKNIRELGLIAGIGEKRMWEIEQMESPPELSLTLVRITQGVGRNPETVMTDWLKEPSPDTRESNRRRKKSAATSPDIPAGIAPLNLNEPPMWDLDVRASAWAQMPLCELDPDDPRQQAIVNTGRFRLRILGTCMEPTFHDGDTVEFEIIRVQDDGPVIGECYAICKCDGLATFKQLVGRDEDSLIFAALNQADFPGTITVPIQGIGRLARAVEKTVRVSKIPVVKVRKVREAAKN